MKRLWTVFVGDHKRIKHRYLTPIYGPKPYDHVTICDLLSIVELHLEDTIPCSYRSDKGFDAIIATRADLTKWLSGDDFTDGTRKRIDELAKKRKDLSAADLKWLNEAEQAESDMLMEQTLRAMGAR